MTVDKKEKVKCLWTKKKKDPRLYSFYFLPNVFDAFTWLKEFTNELYYKQSLKLDTIATTFSHKMLKNAPKYKWKLFY